MTRDEQRLYLIGKCLSGAAHRSPSRASAASMATRAIEIADGVLDAIDAESERRPTDRPPATVHDTIPPDSPCQVAHPMIVLPMSFDSLDDPDLSDWRHWQNEGGFRG